MLRFRECTTGFPEIWRVFISGSSASGKTFFTHQLIESGLIDFQRIYYFHPDIHENDPIQWNRNDIIFSAGLPDTEILLKIPENSCIILDDLFSEAKDSRSIDYLFRVLSGKRRLHCFIMTQRYFSNGTSYIFLLSALFSWHPTFMIIGVSSQSQMSRKESHMVFD